MTILPIDEINALADRIKVYFEDDGKGRIKSRKDADAIIDEMFDLFMLSYVYGANATDAELGMDAMPSYDAANDAVYKPVAGETWLDRVDGYYENGGSMNDILRIAETDATRIYNQGALDAVIANDAQNMTMKRWRTMDDDRVRSTHQYLEGMEVAYYDDFWTFDGDHASAPGMFNLPENNINCRCVVEVIPA